MWFFLAGILMCYLFGFLIYCCYNTSRRRISLSSSDVENPSTGRTLSALRPDGTITTTLCCDTIANGERSRSSSRLVPSFNRNQLNLPLSCLYYDDDTQRNFDLPQSALAAQREQQLRQIKLEINELSQRLGIGQLYRERQLYLQTHNRRAYNCTSNYPYVPVAQSDIVPQHPIQNTFTSRPRPRGVSSGHNNLTRGPRLIMARNEINDEGSSSPSSSSEGSSLDITLSNSLPLPPTHTSSSSISTCDTFSSPARLGLVQTFTLAGGGEGVEERNEIFHQRQRRLRLIRMEIEDLTLQLSSLSEDRSNSDNNAGGCSISSSDLEGLFEPDTDEDDYGPGINLNSSSFSYQPGELPSYDESVIVPAIEKDFDESPPPSYAQCTFSFLSPEDIVVDTRVVAYSSIPHHNPNHGPNNTNTDSRGSTTTTTGR